MASYHCHVRPGPKGKGADHAQYIERGGRFSAEKYGEIGEHARGNLPAWAQGSAARFFAAADEHGRANGNSYREFELAPPVELTDAERGALVRAFVAEQLGGRVREWVQGLWQRRDLGLERGVDREGPRERPILDLAAVKAQGRAASDRWREQLHERQAQAKQQALEHQARKRVVQSFQQLALGREARRFGYGDRSEAWRATPAALREQIDRYNALPAQA
jgi:hypothetical protein